MHQRRVLLLAAHRQRGDHDDDRVRPADRQGATTLATFSNLNKATGYVQRSFALSGVAGSSVTLSFSGTEDTSLQTSFVVDDAALTVS